MSISETNTGPKRPGLGHLSEFGQMVLDELKEAITEGMFELDAETIADMAVKSGLMLHEPYDPKRHENVSSELEPGDKIYYWGKVKVPVKTST